MYLMKKLEKCYTCCVEEKLYRILIDDNTEKSLRDRWQIRTVQIEYENATTI
jgi:hypothetical protein